MKNGDICYIIENGRKISKAEVLSVSGNLHLIRLENGKVLRLPKHRLYVLKEDAEKCIPKREHIYKSPYDYMYD